MDKVVTSDRGDSKEFSMKEEEPVKKSSRRPDIDLIRVVLTWAILLYHVVLIYAPFLPYHVKISPQQTGKALEKKIFKFKLKA